MDSEFIRIDIIGGDKKYTFLRWTSCTLIVRILNFYIIKKVKCEWRRNYEKE